MLDKLKLAAKSVISKSYSPYSRFAVSAALSNDKNQIFTGVNVENASYGLTICAERNAIFSAVTSGLTTFETIVIYVPGDTPVSPCGACRQVISEFSENARVVCFCDSDKVVDTTIDQLLPDSFRFKRS